MSKKPSNPVYLSAVLLLLLVHAASLGAPPVRVPSFGPNGTHWPELIETPFMYAQAALDIELPASWGAVEDAVNGLTDEQVDAGVRILLQPGTIVGKGSSSNSTAMIDSIGKSSWTKRVTICPRDGYGSVILDGGHKFTRTNNICFAGFMDTEGILFVGCDGTALAWSKVTYLKATSDLNEVSKMEFVEVVIPESLVENSDVSQIGAENYQVQNFRWDGCYFAPHFYEEDTTPRPHTDTLQFYQSEASWSDWDMTIRDTAIFGSNNAALQTGGVDGIAIINSYFVNGSVNLSRYPVKPGGETDELSVAINGAGQNWTIEDSHVSGSVALSNPNGLFSNQPFSSVDNTTVSFGSNGLLEPKNGFWTLNTNDAFYLASMPPYPTDDYLNSIWSIENVSGNSVVVPVFSPVGGIYDMPQSVSMTTTTPGASIYYTIDGSIPGDEDTLYTAPVTVSSDLSLRAVAIDGALNDSKIQIADYLFRAASPTIMPSNGAFTGSVEVTITTSTQGSLIYYTLDGSPPDEGALFYGGPFELASTATVKAIAIHPNLDDSEIVSSHFTSN